MNNKLLWIMLAMLAVTTPTMGQVNNNDDDTDDEDEIVVTDNKGREEVIEFPEAMTYDLDSLLNLYMSKTYLEEEDCNMRDINPVYSKEDYIGRLLRLPNVMEMVYIYQDGNVLCDPARNAMETTGKVCYAVRSEVVDTCALHVTSTEDIALFATNYKRATFDATNVIPTTSLLDKYMIQTYTPSDHDGVSATQGSHFAIIASEDNTVVDYYPTVATKAVNDAIYADAHCYILTPEEMALLNFKPGDKMTTPVLKKGEVFYVWTGKKDGAAGGVRCIRRGNAGLPLQ